MPPASEFPLSGPPFDPIAKPDTKRENPTVWPIAVNQVDLVRGGMKAFDIVPVNDKQLNIGVIVSKKEGDQDKKKIDVGKVKVFVANVFQLDQDQDALELVAAGHPNGKIVVAVA